MLRKPVVLERCYMTNWIPWQKNALTPAHFALLMAMLALFIPSYIGLSTTLWQQDDYAHGPLIVLIIFWLCWRERSVVHLPIVAAGWSAWCCLLLGCMAYLLGRPMQVLPLEMGAQILISMGCVLLLWGWAGLKRLWFPILYLIFLIPLPGILVDAATGSLKGLISGVAEEVLYSAGYPIARSGVMLTIGQYQLLVADACSGLHSIFSLYAIGSLYLFLSAPKPRWLMAVLLLMMLPIAIFANIVRVMILVLVTYYFGNAAGQGFIHGFSGMTLFALALISLLTLDTLLCKVVYRLSGRKGVQS